MCGGERDFTTSRWGKSLGLLSPGLFGGAQSSAFSGHTLGKWPSTKAAAPSPTDRWSGHADNPCVVQTIQWFQKLRGGVGDRALKSSETTQHLVDT